MTKRQTPTNANHSQIVSQALQAKAVAISDAADRRLNDRNEGGRFVAKLTEDQWEWVIERVRDGDTDANIARELDIHRGAIATKRRQDPDFAVRYMEALEDAFINIAQDTRDVARGVEGVSSGDVQRDRLIVETDLKLAAKFARKILGDRPMIEAGHVSIVLRNDSDDIC